MCQLYDSSNSLVTVCYVVHMLHQWCFSVCTLCLSLSYLLYTCCTLYCSCLRINVGLFIHKSSVIGILAVGSTSKLHNFFANKCFSYSQFVQIKHHVLQTPAPSDFADLPSRIFMESKSSTDQSSRRRIFSSFHAAGVAFRPNVQFFDAVTEFQCSFISSDGRCQIFFKKKGNGKA